MSGEGWTVRNKHQAEMLCQHIMEQAELGRTVTYSIERAKRTPKQNAALWPALKHTAEELNARGIVLQSVANVIESRIEVSWDKEIVKTNIWDPIQMAIYQKGSSTKLTTSEFCAVVGSFQRCLSENFDINIPFGVEALQ